MDIPVVSVIHNNYVWLSEQNIEKYIDADKEIKKYLAVSKNVSRYSRYYYHISPQKIEVIPNGIDIEAFIKNSQNIIKGRVEFGLKDDDYVFLNVASYEVVKGHNLMLSAMAEVIKRYPKVKLVCAGSSSNSDYYNKLKSRVKEYGLENNVILTGYIPIEDLYSLYKISNAFILPSLIEGWSISLMEAMLNGLPIIVTDVGSSQELVRNHGIGIVIPNAYGDIINLYNRNLFQYIDEERPANTRALTDAMTEFYIDNKKWAEAGKRGIDIINRSYDIKRTIKKYEELLIQSVYIK
jgi:glycosyltransferase involved in cell wall biosynthesis